MIPLEFLGGLLFVSVAIVHSSKETRIRAIIDTGSAGSAIDINLLKPDFTRPAKFAEIVGVGGSQPAVIQAVDSLEIGNLILRERQLEFADLENSFGIQGIIGNDLLDLCNATIDFQPRALSVNHPDYLA